MPAKPNQLRDEALSLRARYDDEPSHSDHVTALALQLFDALKAWHPLGNRSRELLTCGALLHDIGWSQTADGTGHHKASARLIREHAWQHLEPKEIAIVAQVARYHRKSMPKGGHVDFAELDEGSQRQVMILGGILRIADALDRTHTGRIARVKAARIKDNEIVVTIETTGAWEAERAMFETKRDMLEKAAGRPVRCEAS